MSVLARLAPALAIALATFVCALPWGAGGQYRLVLPLLPYAVIHRCIERWGSATPDWLVFLAGFAMDVVGQGPLGYWSFIYLCGYTMVRSSTVGTQPRFVSSISLFLLTIVSITLMQWSLSSIYDLRSAQFMPHVLAASFATGVYLMLLVLIPSASSEPARLNSRLERGI
jgi:hypothetical protein